MTLASTMRSGTLDLTIKYTYMYIGYIYKFMTIKLQVEVSLLWMSKANLQKKGVVGC